MTAGDERLLAYLGLETHALVLAVGLASREECRDFNRKIAWFLLAGMGLAVLVVAGWVLIRSGQRVGGNCSGR